MQTKAVYLALGVTMEGEKELLGLWLSESEGAKFWLSVFTELQNCGVTDCFIACVDGLKGLPEAIEACFPRPRCSSGRCLTGVDVLYSKPSLNPILLNTIECDHDSPSLALSPLPRDRYCPPWPDSAREQRYRCREQACASRTFLLDYSYPGQSPAVKQQIVEMAMNASGIRDTARVLHVSTNTVMTELKKRNRHSST